MPRVLHDGQPSVRSGRGDPLRRAGVAVIAGARDRQQRWLQRAQLVPDRLEHALPGRAQEESERARVLGQPPRPLLLHERVRLVGEQRLALPEADDVLDRHGLDPRGELLVGLRARQPQRALLDPRRGAHEHEGAVGLGRAQGGAQREPPAERVPHEHVGAGVLDLANPALEAVLAVVEHRARIAFREELRDRPPGVATLHEARDEEHHRSNMIPINRTYAPLQAFVEELYRCGMRHAVTSPGSRNAPLALTLASQEGVEAVSVLDERSAGFVALGMAKASGRPVAVTCTSGTAAANLHPAVVEAHEARVPLIVLTADRPPELREVGAGQAIDQIKLYGSAAKWFVEVGNHDPGRETAVHHRALACRAYWTAAGGRPGPVHLNFPLREQLAPAPEPLTAEDWEGRRGDQPWTE